MREADSVEAEIEVDSVEAAREVDSRWRRRRRRTRGGGDSGGGDGGVGDGDGGRLGGVLDNRRDGNKPKSPRGEGGIRTLRGGRGLLNQKCP